jgi:hypothetical protein
MSNTERPNHVLIRSAPTVLTADFNTEPGSEDPQSGNQRSLGYSANQLAKSYRCPGSLYVINQDHASYGPRSLSGSAQSIPKSPRRLHSPVNANTSKCAQDDTVAIDLTQVDPYLQVRLFEKISKISIYYLS